MQWSAYDILLLSSLNLCVALAATPASAADGVIEINHTRALAGGVTPADSPGFPVTISLPGSYVLTSDLTVNGLDTHGIDVFFDDVTIDLAGFTIQGGCPVAGCSAGAGNGLAVYAPGNRNEVRDGRVRGFALGGVALGTRSRITRLMAHDTGGLGISTGSWADIADSQSHSNPHGAGISAGSNSLIRGCVAHSNGQGGISAGAHSIILDSIARINGGSAGITAASGTLVLGNTSAANSSNGIRATGTGSLILENAVSGTTG